MKAIGKGNENLNLSNSFNIENKPVSNKTEIADAFNNVLANIGYKVNQHVPCLKWDFTSYFPSHNAQSMFLDPEISADIITLTKEFK